MERLPRYAAFSTGISLNPSKGNEYFTAAEGTALVLIKVSRWSGAVQAKTPIVLTGWGEGYRKVGDLVDLYGDQTGRDMGTYRVLAVVGKGGRVEGPSEYTNRSFRHFVMK